MALVNGVIETFDAPRGVGSVRCEGDESLFFHCTAIADGTRLIEVGTKVMCTRRPGQRGEYEAVLIRKI
jgi:cold shock CspA family protein